MLISRFAHKDLVKYGTVDGNTIHGLEFSPFQNLKSNLETDGTIYEVDDVKILYPCQPSKIVAIGLNYMSHVTETDANRETPKAPIIFLKPTSCLISPGDNIILRTDGRTDHEAELCVIIGKTAKDVPLADGKEYINIFRVY